MRHGEFPDGSLSIPTWFSRNLTFGILSVLPDWLFDGVDLEVIGRSGYGRCIPGKNGSQHISMEKGRIGYQES